MQEITGLFGPTIKGFDYLPWTDSETVLLWDCKFACCSTEEQKDAIRYPYSWVLVHSRQPDDIYRGITMLKDLMESTSNPNQKKKQTYLLAVAFYRYESYARSTELVDECLKIKPDCWKSRYLKQAIELRLKKTEPKTTSSRSSYPWGIKDFLLEKVSNWMRPTLKKSTQHIEIDGIDLWVLAASAAVGYVFAAAFCRSK